MRYWSGWATGACTYVGSKGIGFGPGVAGARKSKLVAVRYCGVASVCPPQESRLQYPEPSGEGTHALRPSAKTPINGKRDIWLSLELGLSGCRI